jgi:RNA ligase
MKLNIEQVNKEVENKNLNVQKHPEKDLWIYKYTNSCVFEKNWNEITLACRGMVLDADGNVISNPMPKFFNYEDVEEEVQRYLILRDNVMEITDKLDGSLIMAFKYKGELIVTSSGSFASVQAQKAKEMLETKYKDVEVKDGLTYIFEIIYPENRIVLDYGDLEQLTLLGIRDTDTGQDLELDPDGGFSTVELVRDKNFNMLLEEKQRADYINKEGYVVAFKKGFEPWYRVKIKYEEYMRLHKIVSGVNEKYIWECLKDEVDMKEVLDAVPDEMFSWIQDYEKKLREEFLTRKGECEAAYHSTKKELGEFCERKEFARVVMTKHKAISKVLFALEDERKYDHMIWKELKPENVTKFGMGDG